MTSFNQRVITKWIPTNNVIQVSNGGVFYTQATSSCVWNIKKNSKVFKNIVLFFSRKNIYKE